jgi:predicted membrane-bound spermidine synthase
MRKRFLLFTFEREAKWLIVLYVLLPVVGILVAIVIPGIVRRWFG